MLTEVDESKRVMCKVQLSIDTQPGLSRRRVLLTLLLEIGELQAALGVSRFFTRFDILAQSIAFCSQ